MCKVKHNDNVDKTTITALWEMKVHQEAISIAFFVLSVSTGRPDSPKPPTHRSPLSLSVCVYIHLSSPLLAHSEARTEGEILKNKSDARQCVFPRWFIQFEKISEKQWVQVLRESVQWQHFFQHDDRTSERQKCLANWSPRENKKKWKYTHYMT